MAVTAEPNEVSAFRSIPDGFSFGNCDLPEQVELALATLQGNRRATVELSGEQMDRDAQILIALAEKELGLRRPVTGSTADLTTVHFNEGQGG